MATIKSFLDKWKKEMREKAALPPPQIVEAPLPPPPAVVTPQDE